MEEQKATKVTLYLPHDLHRQLKIRSAVEGEAMSALAKRAIDFYLAHSDIVVEGLESVYGQTHRIHSCPSCATALVVEAGELIRADAKQSSEPSGDSSIGDVDISEMVSEPAQMGEGELVVC
ncbi:MAG: hypothetical protein HC922_09870 [Leptolyngbyaceae cyanobacterium SM2_3_12]|nr:hypothetical protein [Leptolyngbyaceae cyanobacterium SM2_3_12]